MPASRSARPCLLLALVALAGACGAAPQAELGQLQADLTAPILAWANEPGGVSVATDAAENVYTARWDYNPAGDIYLAKRSAAGALLWEARYDNVDSTRHEVATWVETDARGDVFVSGTIRSGYSSPVNANSLLMKFGPDGQLRWRRVYDGAFDGSSTRKLLVDAEGNAYVLGIGMSPGGQRTTVRKFAPDGTTVWAWFDPAGIGAPLNFKWTADGALVISARSITGILNGFARIDREGRTIWTIAGASSTTTGDVAGDGAGNGYLVTGNPAGGCLLKKVGPDGATLWSRAHPMLGMRVEVGRDGAPVIGGYPAAGFGAAFAKFDAAGNLLWTNLDADGPGVALLAHGQMRLDGNDDVFQAAGNMSQMGVTKVTSAGASAWVALVPYGYGVGLAFGQAGRVYVVGGQTARLDPPTGSPPPPPPPPPPPAPSADLRLTLADSPDPVRAKARLTLTATVTSAGPSVATGTVLGVTLPASAVFVSATPSQGTCAGTSALTCSLGSLAPGASARVVIEVRPQLRGTLTTRAAVAALEADPVASDNSAVQSTTVRR